MFSIRTILCPTDFSPSSDRAFQLACSLAKEYGAKLTIMHVVERPLMVLGGVMTPPPPPSAEIDREAIREQLERVRPVESDIRFDHRLEFGDPATAILQVASESKSDMIVMGTHGRSGLSRLLMGSVAEKVLRGATCPMVTVKVPT